MRRKSAVAWPMANYSFEDYRYGCPNGHKPDPKDATRCKKCGKALTYSDGLHVHDPRNDK